MLKFANGLNPNPHYKIMWIMWNVCLLKQILPIIDIAEGLKSYPITTYSSEYQLN